MTLQDTVREATRELSDRVDYIKSRCERIESEKAAAEERWKHLSTEITLCRQREDGLRRQSQQLHGVQDEIQRRLDELDQQRSILVDSLLAERAKAEQARQALHDEKHSEDTVREKLSAAELQIANAKQQLAEADNNRLEALDELTTVLRETLQRTLTASSAAVATASVADPTWLEQKRNIDKLHAARHEDPAGVGSLCEQREQYLSLLGHATVPEVRDTIKAALAGVEQQIDSMFPGSLSPRSTETTADILEIYSFLNRQGRVSILLPMNVGTWQAISSGETGPQIDALMLTLWHMVRGLGLRPDQGEFAVLHGFPRYDSAFDAGFLPLLEGFRVALPSGRKIEFRFTQLPNELREVVDLED
jgi:hypothetical protein